jgi:hypothetical protein
MASDAICQILARMVLWGVGGTLLVTDPDLPVAAELLDLTYRFTPPSTSLKEAVTKRESLHHRRDTEEPVRAALDFAAGLTRVDGVLHLGSDLTLYHSVPRRRFAFVKRQSQRQSHCASSASTLTSS